MKKSLTILIALLLISILALSACGSAKPKEDENTVNFPVIDVAENTQVPATEEVLQPEPETEVEVTYPVEGAPATQGETVMAAYPIDKTSPDYDQQMQDYLKNLFGDKHNLDSLLAMDLTEEQLREVLTNEKHAHLNLGDDAIQAIIDWFMSK